jgi:hypothetical protein
VGAYVVTVTTADDRWHPGFIVRVATEAGYNDDPAPLTEIFGPDDIVQRALVLTVRIWHEESHVLAEERRARLSYRRRRRDVRPEDCSRTEGRCVMPRATAGADL